MATALTPLRRRPDYRGDAALVRAARIRSSIRRHVHAKGSMPNFNHRLASMDDLPTLHGLVFRAITELQKGFLNDMEIEASHKVMGLDSQLVKDGTYFILEQQGTIVGCGGWSWRATLYGGDAGIVAREPVALDPSRDAARIRAMYTEPAFARRGVGRRIMQLCEQAAADHGFRKIEMMATLSGEPLYRACGYRPIEHVQSAPIAGIAVPLIRMGKSLGA
jgi:GNAT superfamily N-acetyltransferase